MAGTTTRVSTAAVSTTADSSSLRLCELPVRIPDTCTNFVSEPGVADAHNLAWKLAFVTRGIAGPELLETYDAERRPAAALTVEQAYTRYVLRVDNSLPKDRG